MKIFNVEVSKFIITRCGLNHPERCELHTHTWRSVFLDLINGFRSASILYLVWKGQIHLSGAGRMLFHQDKLVTDRFRFILQESERSKWSGLRKSLRNTE